MSATAAADEFNDLLRDQSRLTSHPSDAQNDDDARSFLDLSSEDDDHTPPASHHEDDNDLPRSSTSFARNTIPTTRYAANTGPKGVISDAQNFRDSRRSRRISTQSSSTLQQAYERRTPPTFTSNAGAPPNCSEKLPEESDEDLLADDEGDDEFMREWRQSRLREMQNGGRGTPTNRGSARAGVGGSEMIGPRRTGLWGGISTVDGLGFLEAVDLSPADVVVVVYIYDDYSQVSSLLESHIRALAARNPDVRFVRLHFEDAEMEPAGVPALLAYRGGEKFAGLVPLVDEIPDDADVSDETLEVVLRRHQILR